MGGQDETGGYTAFADQVDETDERIIDEAIEFSMRTQGWTRNGDGNYLNPGAPDFEITPPGKPKRTTGGQVTYLGEPDSWGFPH